ncbi:hypothetical protein KY284_036495 [Solanum tuberosum]|nr:hypothetical protein KY284_036495 [Solanum tuberosum]
MKEIASLKQEKGEPVYELLSNMESIWNQLTLTEPVLRNSDVAAKFLAYRNNDKLIQFLMALTEDYEPTQVALLNQQSLPTLENALSRLKSEKTHLDLTRPMDNLVFVATNIIGAKFCRNCRQTGHALHDCPVIECNKCKKKAHISRNCPPICKYCKKEDHLIENCPTRPQNKNQFVESNSWSNQQFRNFIN